MTPASATAKHADAHGLRGGFGVFMNKSYRRPLLGERWVNGDLLTGDPCLAALPAVEAAADIAGVYH